MFNLKFNPWKSLTTRGVAIAVGGYLWSHFDPSSLGANGGAIVSVVGTILGALGLRNRLEGPTNASL